jgi:hypothetical protein
MAEQNNPLNNVSAKQLSDYSAKIALIGDRSTRSKQFRELWNQNFAPIIQRRLNLLTNGQVTILDGLVADNPAFLDQSDSVRRQLLRDVAAELRAKSELSDEDGRALADKILAALHDKVYQPIKDGKVQVPSDTSNFINTTLIPALAGVHEELVLAKQNLNAALEQFSKRPLLTLEYTGHRNLTQSGYAEFKLLYDQHVAPLDVILNAGFSTYNTPNPVLHQERIREYHGTFSLAGTAKNPFPVSERDFGKMTYSLSGQIERFQEKNTNIAVANFRFELPVAAALSIPFSISYANRTELLNEKEVKGHFGLTFDLDKLYALTRDIAK